MREKKLKVEKLLLLSVKIAVGASLAIYIAEYFRLENAASVASMVLGMFAPSATAMQPAISR